MQVSSAATGWVLNAHPPRWEAALAGWQEPVCHWKVVPGWWSVDGGGHACSMFLSMEAVATRHPPTLTRHLHTGCMSGRSLQPVPVFLHNSSWANVTKVVAPMATGLWNLLWPFRGFWEEPRKCGSRGQSLQVLRT